jgi:hypothetical protein
VYEASSTVRPLTHSQALRDRPASLRRRLILIPGVLWLITALWGTLLLGASVLWPMSYGYDEPHHIDMAYVYSNHPFHFYGPGQLHVTKADVGMQLSVPGYPPRQSLATAPILPRSQRPSFTQLGGHTLTTGGQPNQMVQHPPLYYWMEAVVLRMPGVSNLAWDLQVWLMRLLSVGLMLPLPLLCWATTRRLLVAQSQSPDQSLATSSPPVSRWAGLATAAAVIPLTVPNMIRDGSSVNNDSLLILTTSVLLYLVSRVITGDLSRKTAGWIAISVAAALWTKGYGLVLPPIVLSAYLIGARSTPTRPARWNVVLPPVVIAAVGVIVGGLWWFRNIVRYHVVQPDGFSAAYQTVIYGKPDNAGTLGHFVPGFVTGFAMRIWGGIGLPDTPSDGPFIIYGWFFLVGAGVVAAWLIRGGGGDRLKAALLVAAPLLTAFIVADGSLGTYRKWSTQLTGVQGRYLYSAFVAISALAVIGWGKFLQPRFHTVLTPVLVVGAIVSNAAAWVLILRSWYQPKQKLSFPEGLRAAVDSLLRWSPLPLPATLLIVVVIPALTSAGTAAVVIRQARRSPDDG